MTPLLVAGGVVALVLVVVIVVYNGLVAKKNQVDNAFAGIDATLKKRFDLVPNLVAMVKQYMLEDPEFERLFAVYATDQMVARYVLSPSLMKRITEYRQSLKHPLWMSFIDGVLYVAIAPGRDLFEPKLLSVVDGKQCMSIFDDIAVGLGIIEDLNLNTRIWSKQ